MKEGSRVAGSGLRRALLIASSLCVIAGLASWATSSWLSNSQTIGGLKGRDVLHLRAILSQSLPDFSVALHNLEERDPEEAPILLARLLSMAVQGEASSERIADVAKRLERVIHAREHSRIITRLVRAHESGKKDVVIGSCEELETWFSRNRDRLEFSKWGYWRLRSPLEVAPTDSASD